MDAQVGIRLARRQAGGIADRLAVRHRASDTLLPYRRTDERQLVVGEWLWGALDRRQIAVIEQSHQRMSQRRWRPRRDVDEVDLSPGPVAALLEELDEHAGMLSSDLYALPLPEPVQEPDQLRRVAEALRSPGLNPSSTTAAPNRGNPLVTHARAARVLSP